MSFIRKPNDQEPIHPLVEEWVQMETRRQFFHRGMNLVGTAALAV